MCTNFTPTQNREWVKATLGVELPSGYPAEVCSLAIWLPLPFEVTSLDGWHVGWPVLGLSLTGPKTTKFADTLTPPAAKRLQKSPAIAQLGGSGSLDWPAEIRLACLSVRPLDRPCFWRTGGEFFNAHGQCRRASGNEDVTKRPGT